MRFKGLFIRFSVLISVSAALICTVGTRKVMGSDIIRSDKSLTVNITKGSAGLLLAKGEDHYTNEAIIFSPDAAGNEELIRELLPDVSDPCPEYEACMYYAISDKEHAKEREYKPLTGSSYRLEPEDGYDGCECVCISFMKKIRLEDTELVIESDIYNIIFDLEGAVIETDCDKDPGQWTNEDIELGILFKDEGSGVRYVRIYDGEELIFERDYEEYNREEIGCGIRDEEECSLRLYMEARDDNGNELKIECYDRAGNRSEHMIRYRIDKTAPSLSYDGIADGLISAEELMLTLKLDDNFMKYTTLHYTMNMNKNSQPDVGCEEADYNGEGIGGILEKRYEDEGNYLVGFYALDEAGNRSETILLSFRIDLRAPVISISGVSQGACYTEGISVGFTVEELFFDDMELKLYVERLMGGMRKAYDERPSCGAVTDTKTFFFSEDGDYHLIMSAADMAGHECSKELFFRIDKTPPTLFISDGSKGFMEKGSILNKKPVVNAVVTDNFDDGCRVSAALVKKSSKGSFEPYLSQVYTTENGGDPFSLPIEDEGVFELCMIATDRAGNTSSEMTGFTVDVTAPRIGYLDDYDERYLKSFYFPEDFSEYISDLTKVEYEAHLNSQKLPGGSRIIKDGRYFLKLTAVDEAGNRSSRDISFIIDNTPPRIVVSGLLNDGTVKKDETLTLSVFDEGDCFTSVIMNGRSIDIGPDNRRVSISIDDYGEYDIVAEASDLAGNLVKEDIELECRFAASPGPDTDIIAGLKELDAEKPVKISSQMPVGIWLAICGIIVATAVIFALITFVDRRREGN